jgi:hypothetical protein
MRINPPGSFGFWVLSFLVFESSAEICVSFLFFKGTTQDSKPTTQNSFGAKAGAFAYFHGILGIIL